MASPIGSEVSIVPRAMVHYRGPVFRRTCSQMGSRKSAPRLLQGTVLKRKLPRWNERLLPIGRVARPRCSGEGCEVRSDWPPACQSPTLPSTDDDGDLRDTTMTLRRARSGFPYRCAQLHANALPGAPRRGAGAETGGSQAIQESRSYLALRKLIADVGAQVQ